MPENPAAPASSALFTRRSVLTVAGTALGTAVIQSVLPLRAVAAEPVTDALALEAVAAADTVQVLSANPSAMLPYPRHLALRVRNGAGALPAGTRVDVTFDPRVYAATPTPILTMGGRRVTAFTATEPAVDRRTGVTSRTVTVDVPIPQTRRAEDALVIVLGTVNPSPYPYDLVRAPVPVDAQVPAGRTGRPARGHRRFSGSARRLPGGELPWGIELAGWWGRQAWGADQEYLYYHPTQVTLRSVGPGAVPAAPRFVIDVDPRLVRDMRPTFVRLNNKPRSAPVRRTAVLRNTAVFRTEWTVPFRLRAGDVVDVGFTATLLTPAGALPTIKHPVIALGAMGLDPRQRDTGLTSISRLDSQWQPADR